MTDGPWTQFQTAAAAGPWDLFKSKATSTDDAVTGTVKSVAQGMLANFGDEAKAAVHAAVPSAIEAANTKLFDVPEWFPDFLKADKNPTPVAQGGDFGSRYDQELEKIRGNEKGFAAEHPTLATAGNIGGSVVGAVTALPAALTRSAPSLLGNAAKIGATGAVLGGLAGVGEGEGASDRIGKGIVGAGVGGATGAALPFVGAAGKAIMESGPGRYVSEKVVSPAIRSLAEALGQSVPSKSLSAAAPDGGASSGGMLARAADTTGNVAQAGAVDRLATAMQRAKINAVAGDNRLAQLGPEGMLADIDPQFLSMASGAHTLPGETRTIAPIVLGSRDRQTGNRIAAAFEGNEPPPSSFALAGKDQAFDQNLRSVGNRVYQEMGTAGLKQSPELMAIYENPHVAEAIDRTLATEKSTRIGTNRPPSSPVEIMHKVKQAIWDLGFDKDTARPGPMASWYRDLGVQYMDRLKAANPTLADADRAYGAAASLPEHFDAGRSLLRRGSTEAATDASAPALADLLGRANQQQLLAARAGATNAVRETALEGTRPARALAQRIDQSAPVQEKIAALFPPAQAQSILRRAQTEGTFANTSNKILSGSQTAEKATDAATLGNSGLRITNQGIGARAMEHFTDILAKLEGPNEPVRNEIGRMMLNPNSDESKRFLKLAQAILDRRAAGTPIRAGLIEGAASTANQ